MTKEGRRRMSEAQKKRWAEKKGTAVVAPGLTEVRLNGWTFKVPDTKLVIERC